MIVTSLAVDGNYVWTGAWDGHVKRWKIVGDKLEGAGDVDLGGCVNSIVTYSNTAYAAVSGGKLVLIKSI